MSMANNLKGTDMADSLKDLQKKIEQEIEQEQIQQTKPIPGFERLRYAGNEQTGFWPCGGRSNSGDGYYIRTSDGVPLHFGCMAHLRMWALEWYRQAKWV